MALSVLTCSEWHTQVCSMHVVHSTQNEKYTTRAHCLEYSIPECIALSLHTLDRYGESIGVWGDCLYCDSLNSERISYSCLETSDLISFSYSPKKAIHLLSVSFTLSLSLSLSHSLLLVVSSNICSQFGVSSLYVLHSLKTCLIFIEQLAYRLKNVMVFSSLITWHKPALSPGIDIQSVQMKSNEFKTNPHN